MKKNVTFFVLVTLVTISTCIAVRTTRGQVAATGHMEKARVTQGDNMSIDVTLDRASNLSGSIVVLVSPDGAVNGGFGLSCGLQPAQATCTTGGRMPLDATLGKWVVSKITFTPLSGEAKVLSEHGESTFEVIAHGALILPDSATVSDIK